MRGENFVAKNQKEIDVLRNAVAATIVELEYELSPEVQSKKFKQFVFSKYKKFSKDKPVITKSVQGFLALLLVSIIFRVIKNFR